MMVEDQQNIARNNFFIKLIQLYKDNPSKFNSVIKSDSNLDFTILLSDEQKI